MAEFADLRAQVPLERVFTQMLGVTDFKQSGQQLLGTCPLCGSRSLKVTPRVGMCNCFRKGCQMAGGIVKVVALTRKLSMTDAGNAIEAHFGLSTGKPSQKPTGTFTATFDPLAYQQKLDPEHEALAPLGIASGVIREFGGGYCAKGKLGGHLALALYDGPQIVSFFGVSLDGETIKFARDADQLAVFNASGIEADQPLTIVRDPLAVLRAAENGDNQVIAVFTPYSPDALRRIAAVMEQHQIGECELF